MKLFLNILLSAACAACAGALLLQGILFPVLPTWANILLRLGGAIFLQILFLRIARQKLLRYLPLVASAIAALWGFFLLLTSPSWVNITLGSFFRDYGIFFIGCALVVVLCLLRPRIRKSVRKLRKTIRRRAKQRKMKDIPHS